MTVPDWTVGVCGFGRCGSTMLMSMLVAGGCPAVADEVAPFEVDLRGVWTARPETFAGRCIKLLDAPRWYGEVPPTALAWRFVWLDRNPFEQAKSHVKFLRAVTGERLADDALEQFVDSYGKDRPVLLGHLEDRGPVLVLRYERVLRFPRVAAELLQERVWPDLDVDAAAAVVHQRDGRCRPDLSVELAISRRGAS